MKHLRFTLADTNYVCARHGAILAYEGGNGVRYCVLCMDEARDFVTMAEDAQRIRFFDRLRQKWERA